MAYIPQSGPSSQHPATQLKSIQVIVLALMGGMLAFAGLATYMALTKGPLMVPQQGESTGAAGTSATPAGTDPTMMLFIVTGAMSAISIASVVIVGKMARIDMKKKVAGLQGEARDRAAAMVMMTTTIIAAGFAEGAGLLGAVVVLLTGKLYTLGAVAIAAVLLAMLMPVRARMESILNQLDRDAAA